MVDQLNNSSCSYNKHRYKKHTHKLSYGLYAFRYEATPHGKNIWIANKRTKGYLSAPPHPPPPSRSPLEVFLDHLGACHHEQRLPHTQTDTGHDTLEEPPNAVFLDDETHGVGKV
eukprot:GDKI01049179.1.p2 GENE.GDKI01049179.1~~GDKI01049179.1.p2  ORF type:complete len:115 (+),score=12.01 GDKI01049179.1:87-431(+)